MQSCCSGWQGKKVSCLFTILKNVNNLRMNLFEVICELSVNVISLLNICVKRKIRKLEFSRSIMILSEKIVDFSFNSRAIPEIM